MSGRALHRNVSIHMHADRSGAAYAHLACPSSGRSRTGVVRDIKSDDACMWTLYGTRRKRLPH